MAYFGHVILYLFVLILVTGCSDQEGAVATDDEIRAHVEEYGDQYTDPTISHPLTD